MILTRLLRAVGFQVWTKAELLAELTPPPREPPAQYVVVDGSQLIRGDK